jgi:uncharacterized phage protein (TIGR02218 family)
MRSASGSLQTFLASRPGACWVRHCYTIALNDGTTFLNWTDFDYQLIISGTTYYPAALKHKRMSMRHTVEIPELEFSLFAPDTLTVKAMNIKATLHNGLFDGARVSFSRLWMKTPGDASLGVVLMFDGRVSQTRVTAIGINFTAKGDNVLMNQQAPRSLYQTTCTHTFCDSGCALSAANYTQSFSLGPGGITTTFLPWASAPGTPSLFTLGTLTFTSGVCNGQTRTITNSSASGLTLVYPLYGTPSAGDTFTALMGCARTLYACQHHTDRSSNPINNQQAFTGKPFIPQNELGA